MNMEMIFETKHLLNSGKLLRKLLELDGVGPFSFSFPFSLTNPAMASAAAAAGGEEGSGLLVDRPDFDDDARGGEERSARRISYGSAVDAGEEGPGDVGGGAPPATTAFPPPSSARRGRFGALLLPFGAAACAVASLLLLLLRGVLRGDERDARPPSPYSSLASAAPRRRPLAQPERLVASPDGRLSVRLSVRPSTLSFSNGVSFRARTYDGSFPGPTLVVAPGDKLTIAIANGLGPERSDRLGLPSGTLRHPNTTALHVHGLHVGPREDDVFRDVRPGEEATFEYDIPENHPEGLFYYHPHHHGSAAYQSGYAMLGGIVVDKRRGERGEEREGGEEGGARAGAGAGLVDDVLAIVSQVEVRTRTKSRRSVVRDHALMGDDLPLDLVVPPGAPRKFLVVNGRDSGEIEMDPGRVYRLRVLNAVMDGYLRIGADRVGPGSGGAGAGGGGDDAGGGEDPPCRVAEVAADGVPHAAKREVDLGGGDAVVIPPGSRRDLLVQCAADAVLRSRAYRPREDAGGGTRRRRRSRADDYMGSDTALAKGDLLAVRVAAPPGGGRRLDASDGGAWDAFDSYEIPPAPDGRPYGPEPLADLRSVPVEERNRRTVRYTQSGPSSPRAVRADGTAHPFLGFDGQLYRDHPPLIVRRDEVFELTIVNDVCLDGTPAYESHPFHMHTNHFQVVDVSSGADGVSQGYSPDFRLGDWRDTIAVPAPGNVTVRFVPRDGAGTSLAHCHALAHEDVGMAMKVEIL